MRPPKPAHVGTPRRRLPAGPPPAPIELNVGDVLYLFDNTSGDEDKKHRHVIMACDAKDIVTVSISTSDGRPNTCDIAVGDMAVGVLTRPSFADYKYVIIGPKEGLIWKLSKKGSKKMSTCSPALLNRILEGACADEHVRPDIKVKLSLSSAALRAARGRVPKA